MRPFLKPLTERGTRYVAKVVPDSVAINPPQQGKNPPLSPAAGECAGSAGRDL